MLPSRGVVRSLPSVNAPSQIIHHNVSRTLGHGRRFGTLRTTTRSANGLTSSIGSSVRTRQAVAPLVLGSVASTRNLSWPSMPSLWGYGSKTNETTAASTASATPSDSLSAESAAGTTNTAATAQQPVPFPSAESEAAVAAAEPTTQPDLSAISDLVNSGNEILNRFEDIGYLHSLGIDYGWGPSSLMQWVLEHIHVYGGLGWAGTICATAVVLRIAMIYPTIKSTRFSAQMKKMQADPRFAEVQEKMKASMGRDRQATMEASALNGILRREYNVPFSQMLWGFVPIPLSYGMFRVVTAMTHLPVPALEHSGFFWFTDLTAADPLMILPAVASGLMVLAIKLNARNSPESQQGMLKTMVYVLAPVMFIGTSFLSAAVNLMGVAFGATTLLTTALMNQNSVRRSLNIPELEPQARTIKTTATERPFSPGPGSEPTYEAPRQARSFKDQLNDSISEAKKAVSDKMASASGSVGQSAQDKAEQKRKEMIRKLEEKRSQQERDHFNEKYKKR